MDMWPFFDVHITINTSYLFGVIIRAKIVFRKTVVGDYLIERQSSSESSEESLSDDDIYVSGLGSDIGQFCLDVIGRQNVKVVVIGRLLLLLFSIHLLFVGFI